MKRPKGLAALEQILPVDTWQNDDERGTWWASIELPIPGYWISVEGGPFPSEAAAEDAARKERTRRLALLGELLAGIQAP